METDVAKVRKAKGSPIKRSEAGSYRAAVSGRFVGRTKDGIDIIGPKSRSRHFTKKQARAAVDATRGAANA
jgi:hypothetical protein